MEGCGGSQQGCEGLSRGVESSFTLVEGCHTTALLGSTPSLNQKASLNQTKESSGQGLEGCNR